MMRKNSFRKCGSKFLNLIFPIISFPTEGKDRACDVGSIEVLSNLLSDEDTLVRANACGALMV